MHRPAQTQPLRARFFFFFFLCRHTHHPVSHQVQKHKHTLTHTLINPRCLASLCHLVVVSVCVCVCIYSTCLFTGHAQIRNSGQTNLTHTFFFFFGLAWKEKRIKTSFLKVKSTLSSSLWLCASHIPVYILCKLWKHNNTSGLFFCSDHKIEGIFSHFVSDCCFCLVTFLLGRFSIRTQASGLFIIRG